MGDLFDQFRSVPGAFERKRTVAPDASIVPLLGRPRGFGRIQPVKEDFALMVFKRSGDGVGPGIGQGEPNLEFVPVGQLLPDEFESLKGLPVGRFAILKTTSKRFGEFFNTHGGDPLRLAALSGMEERFEHPHAVGKAVLPFEPRGVLGFFIGGQISSKQLAVLEHVGAIGKSAPAGVTVITFAGGIAGRRYSCQPQQSC